MEAEALSQQKDGVGRLQGIAAVFSYADFQDLGGGVEEDDTAAATDDLPLGIFPEAHPESCHHALRRQGLACTRLNAELFYEMDQLGRNRLLGCSTQELREIDLWDPCSEASIWNEPVMRTEGRLLLPEEQLDNLNRKVRWQHVERFLKEVYGWCQGGQAPEIVVHRNRQGLSTWRFRKLRWTEDGIIPDDSAQKGPTNPAQAIHAAWNFLFWCRRRWLKTYPGKVWLSEHCLHLIRHAFQALLNHFEVPAEDWPAIKEEPKPAWPLKAEVELAELEDREERAVVRLHYLERHKLLTDVKLRQALTFFDDMAEEMAVTQSWLDGEIIKLARHNGYDDSFWGTRLELASLSTDELLEMKEEMRQVTALADDPGEGPTEILWYGQSGRPQSQ